MNFSCLHTSLKSQANKAPEIQVHVVKDQLRTGTPEKGKRAMFEKQPGKIGRLTDGQVEDVRNQW